jgi:hypothetical protein
MKLECSTFLIEGTQLEERAMSLIVSAQVIRELMADGEYLVESIEQREYGKVAVAFVLRSRTQPYSIQIETLDNKLGALFRALLGDKPSRAEKAAAVKVGSQPVPVVQVGSLPADVSKSRKRRKQETSNGNGGQPKELTKPSARGRRSARQLVLVPQEAPDESAPMPRPSKRRRTAGASNRSATP